MNNETELPKEVLEILGNCKLEKMAIKVVYRNWRGKGAIRNVLPLKVWYGSTEWHKGQQWLIRVYDLDKKANRDYTLNDWRGAPEN